MRAQSPGQEGPLEKEMTTHSNILAWRIPWTEEAVELQPMESQKSDDLVTKPQQQQQQHPPLITQFLNLSLPLAGG